MERHIKGNHDWDCSGEAPNTCLREVKGSVPKKISTGLVASSIPVEINPVSVDLLLLSSVELEMEYRSHAGAARAAGAHTALIWNRLLVIFFIIA